MLIPVRQHLVIKNLQLSATIVVRDGALHGLGIERLAGEFPEQSRQRINIGRRGGVHLHVVNARQAASHGRAVGNVACIVVRRQRQLPQLLAHFLCGLGSRGHRLRHDSEIK